MRPDLVEFEDGLDALVQKVRLPQQTATVQGHQLLVEVHREHVEVDAALHGLGLPEGHRTQRASWPSGRRRTIKKRKVLTTLMMTETRRTVSSS